MLVAEHFDLTVVTPLNHDFPNVGDEARKMYHFWGREAPKLDVNAEVGSIVARLNLTTEVAQADPRDYAGTTFIVACAVSTLDNKISAICHSLWLLCLAPKALRCQCVTCAPKICCDVENVGFDAVNENDRRAEILVDCNPFTGKHPSMIAAFIEHFLRKIELQPISSGDCMPAPELSKVSGTFGTRAIVT